MMNTARNYIDMDTTGAISPTDMAKLHQALKRATHAVSRDETRVNIRAIRIERDIGDDEAVIVTTDGHRLAVARAPVRLDRDYTIALGERHKERPGGDLRALRKSPKALLAAMHAAPTDDLRFPQWRRVVPSSQTWSIRVDTGAVKAAIESIKSQAKTRAAAFATENAEEIAAAKATLAAAKAARKAAREACDAWRGEHGVKASRRSSEYKGLLTARKDAENKLVTVRPAPTRNYTIEKVRIDIDSASATNEISATFPGEPVRAAFDSIDGEGCVAIGINPKYLVDAIKAFAARGLGGTVTIEGSAPLSPVRVYGDIADGYAIVMPMRL